MKKLLITFGIVAALAFSVSAQTDGIGLTGKGIKVGLGMANFTGDNVDTDMKLGFNGGAFLTYNFTPMFAIQPEVLYQMKGAKQTIEMLDEDLKYKFDYLTIPVLLKVTPAMQGNIKPYFFAGPQVGFLMSAKISLEGEDDEDIKEYFKSTDFGITFGAGFDVAMQTMKITVDARYELGMTDIPDMEEEEEDISMKNSNIAVMVGLSF